MKQALKPIRRRIRWLRCARGLLFGLLAGAVACLGMTVASFFTPIEALWRYLIILIAACPVLGAALGLLWPVSLAAAARQADACGLKERAITALALSGEDSPMAQLQRRDAQDALAALPVRQAMPFRVSRRVWVSILALMVATGVLLLVPNPQHDALRARERVRQDLRARAEEVEKAAEQLIEDDMTEEEKSELRRITTEMVKDLKEANDQRDALEKLSERQKEMEDLQKNIQERRLEALAAALGSQSGLKGLSEAMQSGDEAQVWDEMEKLAEDMLSDLDSQLEAAEQLAQVADSLPEGSAKQAMAASSALAKVGNVVDSLNSLVEALNTVAATSSSAGSMTINLPMLMSMARNGAAQAGSCNGTGSASGTGTGGGAGAGMGTTNQDAGYTPAMSQSKQGEGKGAPNERIGEYERIYDPTRLGGDGEISHVQGPMGEGDIRQVRLGPGTGDMTGDVPYNQVIGEYQDAASQAMRRNALPGALQEMVERYFNSLID